MCVHLCVAKSTMNVHGGDDNKSPADDTTEKMTTMMMMMIQSTGGDSPSLDLLSWDDQ